MRRKKNTEASVLNQLWNMCIGQVKEISQLIVIEKSKIIDDNYKEFDYKTLNYLKDKLRDMNYNIKYLKSKYNDCQSQYGIDERLLKKSSSKTN